MDANRSGQETHNGAILCSTAGRYDLANAGGHRVIAIPAFAPSAMILILV